MWAASADFRLVLLDRDLQEVVFEARCGVCTQPQVVFEARCVVGGEVAQVKPFRGRESPAQGYRRGCRGQTKTRTERGTRGSIESFRSGQTARSRAPAYRNEQSSRPKVANIVCLQRLQFRGTSTRQMFPPVAVFAGVLLSSDSDCSMRSHKNKYCSSF